jgi:hypothetical protein
MGLLVAGTAVGAFLGLRSEPGLSGSTVLELVSPFDIRLTGLSLQAAKDRAHALGIRLLVVNVPSEAPLGQVVDQDPTQAQEQVVLVSTGPLVHPLAKLAGAKNSPVHLECMVALRIDEDGNAGPLTCGNGHVNVEAWDYFARLHLPVMELPKGSSECQVVSFIRRGFVSAPVNYSGFVLARAYNGWSIPKSLGAQVLDSQPSLGICWT